MHRREADPHAEARVFFDRIAEDYRRRSETAVYNVSSLSFRRRQDVVTECLQEVSAPGTVLDYGMGPAVFGPSANSHGLHYIGIDISPKMIEIARAMDLADAEYHEGDLEILSRFEGKADAVLLIGLIDYLVDAPEGLRRLARCAKQGGRMILSFRNHHSVPRVMRNASKAVWRAIRHGGNKPETTAFEAPVLENAFAPQRDLIPVLREAGFRKFKIRYLDCSPIFFNMPLNKPIWDFWRKFDAAAACGLTSPFCASGVLIGYDKR